METQGQIFLDFWHVKEVKVRVENTELDYEEHESVGLERYLGNTTETKEGWAQRVWDCCRRQSEGEDVSRVYNTKRDQTWQERAKEIWDEKKMRRCHALCREFGENDVSEETLMRIKDDPKYKTRDEIDAELERV